MRVRDFPKTLIEFEERFATEQACREYLVHVRWSEGWRCPACDHDKAWTTARGLWHCARCGHDTSLTAGTIFHGTKKPLRLWFKAMYLITSAKTGVSAKTLQRELGLSYPAAWTWLHKLRQAMSQDEQSPLHGTVETDETMLGKDESRRPGRHKGTKSIVVIAVEDQGKAMGRARMASVDDFSSDSLQGVIERYVAPGSSVHTDGWKGYTGLDQKGYNHPVDVLSEAKTRAAKQARAAATFPHVHRLAGLLKRWLMGTHQGAVHEKHLHAYLDEYVFRFNRRRSHRRTLLFQRLVARTVCECAKPYWRIIGREAPDKPLHLAAA